MKTSKSKKTTTPAPAPARASTVTPAVMTPVAPARATAITAQPITSSSAPVAPKLAPHREVTGETIAARAYTIWEQKGRPQGCDLENWVLAENQLRQEIQALTA